MIEYREPILTADRRVVRRGDRVFNYYDIEWGLIVSEPNAEGWFSFRAEIPGGYAKPKMLNGERICSDQPEWMK